MLSPHTPPGTRVAFVRIVQLPDAELPDIEIGHIATVVSIAQTRRTVSGFEAFLTDWPEYGICLSLLRRVDLPECLTSLLNVAPTDSGADKSISVED